MRIELSMDSKTSANEEAIMQAFRKGDEDSFCWIYDQLVRQLTHFVEYTILSRVDAEDIVANAIHKLFRAREGMKSVDHIKRFLYVVVTNEAIDYLHAKTKRQDAVRNLAYLACSAEQQNEMDSANKMQMQTILQAIDELPRQKRTVLTLYFLKQKSTSEIAEILNLNTQTVLNHKSKALESLRETLASFQFA
jgi:RNA polymerase sigma factor (sigma-70 family)